MAFVAGGVAAVGVGFSVLFRREEVMEVEGAAALAWRGGGRRRCFQLGAGQADVALELRRQDFVLGGYPSHAYLPQRMIVEIQARPGGFLKKTFFAR